MDFKHFDSDELKRYTGVGSETVCVNFEKNCKAGRQQHIRIPLINGINAYSPEKYVKEYGSESWIKAMGFVKEEPKPEIKTGEKKGDEE